ncbi:MAG TPA: hypothetical protein VGF40_19825 [Thermoanaerobaculia bacterium]
METFEASVTELEKAVARLEARVSALERAERVSFAASVDVPPPVAAESAVTDDRESQIALIGRTVVVLGGAYLLRAITDMSVVPRPAGVALGLAYAIAWFVFADRSARAGASLGAAMHALGGVLIAYPLLFEATHRFKVLSPEVGVLLLAIVTGAGITIAWRRSLRPMAWLVTIGAVLGGLLMLAETEAVFLHGIFFIALGVATVWASYVLDWFALRWMPAFVVDLVVAIVTLLAWQNKGGVDRDGVIALQLILVVAYVGTFALRTIVRGREVLPFEIAQTTAALVIGVGGAGLLSIGSPSVHFMLGVALAALGLAAYGVAFVFIDRRGGSVQNFFFYSSVALVLLFYGMTLVLPNGALTLALGGIGIVAALLADRFRKVTLSAHAATYLGGAALASGALASSVMAFAFPFDTRWVPMAWDEWAIAALIGWSVWAIGAGSEEFQERAASPRLILLSLFVLTAAGILLHAVIESGALASAPALAACRTGVLAIAAVLLALGAHHRRLAITRALVYPVLILGAVKLTIEDLRLGTPLTLFVAFALYGGALIVAPRLRKRGKWATALGAPSQQSRT